MRLPTLNRTNSSEAQLIWIHSLVLAMPPGENGTTSFLENCNSVAVATGRRMPMPPPLMQANILSLTK